MSSGSSGECAGSSPDISSDMDRVEVYLRLKPLNEHEESVVHIEDDQSIVVNPHAALQISGQRHLASLKPVRYTFEHIFSSQSNQAEVFERVAIPSVRDVLTGKPALIFMYGVTGSGKTYTMCGTPQSAGILPRTLDVLFNSLPRNVKAMKFLFKPDGLNSYDIRSEADAMMDRQSVMLANREAATQSLDRTPAKKKQRLELREWQQRERDTTRVSGDIPEYCKVAVFVQYVEIYKDYVYDLLEEEPISIQGRAKGPQARLVREDNRSKCMFVLGATEVEVESADEAMEVWIRGQRRKRVASTLMNAESSRSHSVFIVKVVQAPVDDRSGGVVQKKEHLTVTQLNLVDLAGCERQTKTGASGDRLKEANNINQSLASLRNCLALLRENQINPNAKRNIPFRDCKLTYLFRSFFEGRGRVKMVVCANPRAEDCSQTLEVMNFSETAQELELQRVQANRVLPYVEPTPPPSLDDVRMPPLFESTEVPSCLNGDIDDEATMIAIMKIVEEGAKEWAGTKTACYEALKVIKDSTREWEEERRKLKAKLAGIEKERKQQAKIIKDLHTEISQERREKDTFKEKVIEIEAKSEYAIKRAHQLEEAYRKAKEEQIRIKKDLEQKWSKEKELLLNKADRKMNEQRANALRQGAELAKAGLIKDILEKDEFKHITSSGTSRSRTPHKRPQPLKQRTQTFHTIETARNAVGNPRSAASTSEPDLSDLETVTAKHSSRGPTTRSRSKSNDARWLQHTDGSDTTSRDALLQPQMNKRKSVTKLETKDLNSVDRYALITNEGENVQVVKGEVLTSPMGGKSIVFSEVETLKREKVTAGRRKDPTDSKGYVGPIHTKKRCGLAIEGHPYLKNVVRRGNNEKFV